MENPQDEPQPTATVHAWRRYARLLAVLIAVACTLGAAGCGSGESSSTGGATATATPAAAGDGATSEVAAAQRLIEPYVKAPTWHGPTTSPAAAKGKHIIFVNQLPTEPQFRTTAVAAQAAARALGWRVTELKAAALTDLPELYDRAIAQKPDGILISNLSANNYPSVTAALVKSKIPTVAIGVLPGGVNAQYSHVVDIHYGLQGELTGAAAALDLKGHAKLGVLAFAPGFDPAGAALIDGIKRSLSSTGGGSVVATKVIDVATIRNPSAIGQAAVAVAQATSELNGLFVGYDGTSRSVVPALRQAGLLNRVHVLAYQGTPQQLGWVRDGGGQVSDVAYPQEWATWAAFDDFNRLFNGESPPKEDGVPVRLFTKEYPPPAGDGTWSGDLDFAAKYRSLWQVG